MAPSSFHQLLQGFEGELPLEGAEALLWEDGIWRSLEFGRDSALDSEEANATNLGFDGYLSLFCQSCVSPKRKKQNSRCVHVFG